MAHGFTCLWHVLLLLSLLATLLTPLFFLPAFSVWLSCIYFLPGYIHSVLKDVFHSTVSLPHWKGGVDNLMSSKKCTSLTLPSWPNYLSRPHTSAHVWCQTLWTVRKGLLSLVISSSDSLPCPQDHKKDLAFSVWILEGHGHLVWIRSHLSAKKRSLRGIQSWQSWS